VYLLSLFHSLSFFCSIRYNKTITHRPRTPLIRNTFTWYARDTAHLHGIDFHGYGRNFDKTMLPPSPRQKRLVAYDRQGKKGKFVKDSLRISPVRPKTKKRILGGRSRRYDVPAVF